MEKWGDFMRSKKDIVAEFESAVASIREKYSSSDADLYDLEESIFSEIQEVQKNLMSDLHKEKTEKSKKKSARSVVVG